MSDSHIAQSRAEPMNGEQSINGARNLPDDTVVVVPVSNVIFPGVVFPIVLDRPSSVAAAQQALREQHPLVLALQQDVQAPDPGPQSLHRMGTLANVLRYVTGPDGAPHVACQGVERFEINEWVEGFPFLVARGRRIPEPEVEGAEIEARFLHLRSQALEALQLLPQSPPGELVAAVEGASSPAALADLVAAYLDLQPPEKQQILEAIDLESRLDKVSAFLAQRLEVLRLTSEIAQRTRQSLGERQRETLLREQMAAIQRELGEGEREELFELEAAIENADMPEEVVQQARKELRRLARTQEAAAEYGMVRTYLEWLVELPWGVPEAAPIDLAEARLILDEDHFGLEKIKQRIIEHLAVRRLAPEGKAPILCFVGPPGVGKTSLGQSIARAMHRPFVRVSLGGVHDESEIRGHRRTYVGALPGNIIQAIRKAGRRDCVLMLDEIDKMSAGIHGDPSAALLEVLDPEQNVAFRDNYLAVPFDLSRVVFIATANMLDTLPGPLRDRMEIIQLSGYTAGEKRQIAERYLVRRQLEANGLTAAQVQIEPAALEALIARYTREAGVRSLEREIGRVLRHVAVRFAEGHTEPVRIGPTDLEPILGPPRVENEVAMRTSVPGVATGLAWTPVGGEILFIEATRTPGEGRLILTGQLGEVMRESAQTALSLVKSRAEALGVTPSLFKESDIHIHVPAGATPKDGPSAGVAMTMALISLLTERTVRSDTAMTGEISLRGLVLPVGGIKEKVVAAATAGVRRVLLPARNRADERDIPEETRQTLELIWLERIEDAIEAGLDPRRGDVRQTQVRAAS
ncbi:endopeptidase La [Caulobacter sp.]|uniref:endopeptidase La n=1 Tax=Caulobacter sp. TaxID=78 RepID=UPI0025BC19EF|nr:endopeptidase La [Caulobacter sp.]